MPNKYGFRMTKEIRGKAIKLYKSGLSQQNIADIINVDRTAISYWTRKLGISRNLSESHIGRPNKSKTKFKKGQVSWNKGKPGLAREKNPAWKGGVTEKHKVLRSSDQYKQWRRDVFIRDQFTCWKCGHKYIQIVAHHIENFADNEKVRFDIDNGITMCRACHCKLHKPSVGA